MEQITRRDGFYYYGDRRCRDVDEAYSRFRQEFHGNLGRQVVKRLDREGRRVERIHDFGFVFDDVALPGGLDRGGRVDYRILGIVVISYARMFGIHDYPNVPDEGFEDWLDFALSKGSGVMRRVGTRQRTGRTSVRLRTRFR